MFQFFEMISNGIETIINFIVNAVSSVVMLLRHIVLGLTFLAQTIGFLPPFCQGIIFAVLAVSVSAIVLSLFIDLG